VDAPSLDELLFSDVVFSVLDFSLLDFSAAAAALPPPFSDSIAFFREADG